MANLCIYIQKRPLVVNLGGLAEKGLLVASFGSLLANLCRFARECPLVANMYRLVRYHLLTVADLGILTSD